MNNATETEGGIRRDERQKIAELIRENADLFAEFGAGKKEAVLLVALAVGLGGASLPTREAASQQLSETASA